MSRRRSLRSCRLLFLVACVSAATGGRLELRTRRPRPRPRERIRVGRRQVRSIDTARSESTSAPGGTAGAPPAAEAGPTPAPSSELLDPPDLDKQLSLPAPAGPSQNVVINLITRLMQRGVLTRGDAVELIEQAEKDAEVARQNAEAARAAEALPSAEESISVTYIPEKCGRRSR